MAALVRHFITAPKARIWVLIWTCKGYPPVNGRLVIEAGESKVAELMIATLLPCVLLAKKKKTACFNHSNQEAIFTWHFLWTKGPHEKSGGACSDSEAVGWGDFHFSSHGLSWTSRLRLCTPDAIPPLKMRKLWCGIESDSCLGAKGYCDETCGNAYKWISKQNMNRINILNMFREYQAPNLLKKQALNSATEIANRFCYWQPPVYILRIAN